MHIKGRKAVSSRTFVIEMVDNVTGATFFTALCFLLLQRNSSADCVFNETFDASYITYSSSKYSNERRTLYIALNKRGQSRKLQVQKKAPLGKLYDYAKVIIKTVEAERVKDLEERIMRLRESLQTGSRLLSGDLSMTQHPLRHHGYHRLCPQVQPTSLQMDNGQDVGMDDVGRDKLRCRRRKKRKKKKRRCREGEQEGEQCQNRDVKRKKCQQGEGEEECEKRLEAAKRRRKSRNGVKKIRDDSDNNKKKQRNGKNKKKFISDGEIGKDFGSARARTGGLGEYIVTTQSHSPAVSLLSPTTTPPTSSAISVLTSTIIPSASLFSTILTGTTAASSSASVSWSTSTATTRSSTPTRVEDNLPMSSSGISTTAGTPK